MKINILPIEITRRYVHKYGLQINVSKTKCMVVRKNRSIKLNLNVNNQRIEQVTQFRILGCYIAENINREIEIKRRCGYAYTTAGKIIKHLNI